jgi:hypothetical protein
VTLGPQAQAIGQVIGGAPAPAAWASGAAAQQAPAVAGRPFTMRFRDDRKLKEAENIS